MSAEERCSLIKNFTALELCPVSGLFFNNVSKSLILFFLINQSIFIFKNSSSLKFFFGEYAFVNNTWKSKSSESFESFNLSILFKIFFISSPSVCDHMFKLKLFSSGSNMPIIELSRSSI